MADTPQNFDNNGKAVESPATTKVDAPAETPSSELNDSSKPNGDDFKICSPLTKARFSTSGILKPPQLSLNVNNASKSPFVLNPSRLNFTPSDGSSKEPQKSLQANGEAPKFVPLLQSTARTANQTTSSGSVASSSFVFGQNLQDRVVAAESKADEPRPSTSLNSNGTAEMLFSSAIKSDSKVDNGMSNKEAKSLSESAREYEESRAVKRKYEEVEVLTGEEDEMNILNITCKLFAFDKAGGTWQERGRGVLRLNDFERNDHVQSRVLFRTMGSLRVVLNTPIWAEMTVEQASQKSVRFTALDQQGVIKVFLVMASIEDSKQIYSQIQQRVQKEIAAQKRKKNESEENVNSGNN